MKKCISFLFFCFSFINIWGQDIDIHHNSKCSNWNCIYLGDYTLDFRKSDVCTVDITLPIKYNNVRVSCTETGPFRLINVSNSGTHLSVTYSNKMHEVDKDFYFTVEMSDYAGNQYGLEYGNTWHSGAFFHVGYFVRVEP